MCARFGARGRARTVARTLTPAATRSPRSRDERSRGRLAGGRRRRRTRDVERGTRARRPAHSAPGRRVSVERPTCSTAWLRETGSGRMHRRVGRRRGQRRRLRSEPARRSTHGRVLGFGLQWAPAGSGAARAGAAARRRDHLDRVLSRPLLRLGLRSTARRRTPGGARSRPAAAGRDLTVDDSRYATAADATIPTSRPPARARRSGRPRRKRPRQPRPRRA